MSERQRLPEATSRLDELIQWIDEGTGLLLGVDFDGTLSPITEDHADATLAPAMRVVLEELAAAPSVAVAVVSGRSRADLTDRVGVEGVVYAGNHGLELAYDGTETVHAGADRGRVEIRRLCDELEATLASVEGCEVERKGVTATVHYRQVDEDDVPDVVSAVEGAVSDRDGVRVTDGKQIHELRPAVAWDKGRTMRLLGERVPDGWRTMYFGDDTTDEDAFRAIESDGIGVRVVDDATNRTPDSAAQYFLDGQAAVPQLLYLLALGLESDPAREGEADPREALVGSVHDTEVADAPFRVDSRSRETPR